MAFGSWPSGDAEARTATSPFEAATHEQFGWTASTTAERDALAAAVTPAHVQAAFAQAQATAALTVPYGARVDVPGLTQLGGPNVAYVPSGCVFAEKRSGLRRASGNRLVLTPDSISHVDASEHVVTVNRSDAALLDATAGRCVVIGTDLATIGVDRKRFARADEAVDAIDNWFA